MKRALLLLLLPLWAYADVVATVTPAPWDLYAGSTKSQSGLPTEQACINAAKALGVAKSYQCRTRTAVVVKIAVTPPITVQLAWTAPTQNTDGSLLTDLASFRVYCGTAPTTLSLCATNLPVGTLTYTVSNLSLTTWYFAMTAVNSQGVESMQTGVVSKVVK